MLLIGGITSGIGVWSFRDWIMQRNISSLLISCFTLCPGLIVLSGGIWQLVGWVRNRVDILSISESGVEYGGRFWDWNNVQAMYFGLSIGTNRGPHIRLWTKGEKRWPRGGELLLIDSPLTFEEQSNLIDKLRQYLSDRGISVACHETMT
jgi:hypothetical protein